MLQLVLLLDISASQSRTSDTSPGHTTELRVDEELGRLGLLVLFIVSLHHLLSFLLNRSLKQLWGSKDRPFDYLLVTSEEHFLRRGCSFELDDVGILSQEAFFPQGEFFFD